jgi:hypothetical protein
VSGDVAAIGEANDAAVTARLDRRALRGRQDLHPEPHRLVARSLRQLGPGHAVREAEVVLDPARLPGLPTRGGLFDEQCAQLSLPAYTAAPSPAGPPPITTTS